MSEPKQLVVMFAVLLLGIGIGVFWERGSNVSVVPILPTPTVTIVPTGVDSSKLNYTIPVSWLVYRKNFQKLNFYFRYPADYLIQDGDPDSGNIGIINKKTNQLALEIGRMYYYGWREYSGGGRREWYLGEVSRLLADNEKINEGDIVFTGTDFVNGNSFYLVTKSQKIRDWVGGIQNVKEYFGIFSGKAIIIVDWQKMPKEDVYRVMQSLKVE
jgi:hypothetical protein